MHSHAIHIPGRKRFYLSIPSTLFPPSHITPPALTPQALNPSSPLLRPAHPPFLGHTATPLLLHRSGRGRGKGAAKAGWDAEQGITAQQSSVPRLRPPLLQSLVPRLSMSLQNRSLKSLPFRFEGRDLPLFLCSGLRLPPPTQIPLPPRNRHFSRLRTRTPGAGLKKRE